MQKCLVYKIDQTHLVHLFSGIDGILISFNSVNTHMYYYYCILV